MLAGGMSRAATIFGIYLQCLIIPVCTNVAQSNSNNHWISLQVSCI